MKNIIDFEEMQVDILIEENENDEQIILFELYSTGMALGHIKYNNTGKAYPRKDRIDRDIKNAEISTCVLNNKTFINLNNLKKFISISHTENKLKFIEWLVEKGFVSYDEVFDSTRKEILFLNELEESLKPFGIKGFRQYSILTYRIDYYIPSLNIAIEYDENNHKHYTHEAHEGREKEIKRKLGCRFIRVTDENNLGYNLGLVIKNIFNL